MPFAMAWMELESIMLSEIRYIKVESLCCTPETNTILYAKYALITFLKKKIILKTNFMIHVCFILGNNMDLESQT